MDFSMTKGLSNYRDFVTIARIAEKICKTAMIFWAIINYRYNL